jgi:TRAP transporter TAXI family solute receptor
MRGRMLLAAVLVVGLASEAGAQGQMVMATGPIGGAWYPIGSAMTEVLQGVGVQFTQQPGGGVSNAFLVGQGKAQLGFTTADVAASAVNATAGSDFEKRPVRNLRLLATLYPQEYILVTWADSPVKSMAELKGRVVQTTARGTSTELMTRRVFAAVGLDYKDLKSINFSNLNDGVNQMKDGQADAMSHLITQPAPHVVELSISRPVRLLTLDDAIIDKLVQSYSGYNRATIRGGLYPGQDKEVQTVGEPVILVTRAELDDDTVYKMTKTLVESRSRLAAAHKVMDSFTPAEAASSKAIPYHPGAAKFFREAGVGG